MQTKLGISSGKFASKINQYVGLEGFYFSLDKLSDAKLIATFAEKIGEDYYL